MSARELAGVSGEQFSDERTVAVQNLPWWVTLAIHAANGPVVGVDYDELVRVLDLQQQGLVADALGDRGARIVEDRYDRRRSIGRTDPCQDASLGASQFCMDVVAGIQSGECQHFPERPCASTAFVHSGRDCEEFACR